MANSKTKILFSNAAHLAYKQVLLKQKVHHNHTINTQAAWNRSQPHIPSSGCLEELIDENGNNNTKTAKSSTHPCR